MIDKMYAWLDERMGLKGLYDTILDRKIPKVNWWFTLGSASLIVFMIQGITGMMLSAYYIPSPEFAYDSILYIMNGATFGWLIRGIHHWGSSMMVVLVFIHMLRTFFMASYKYPREMTWLTGVLLLLFTVGSSYTGYLLPWHQQAYWAAVVGSELMGTIPVVGSFLSKVMLGGYDVSGVTLARFFSVHVLWLPALLVSVIGVHLYLVIRHGISNIPGEED